MIKLKRGTKGLVRLFYLDEHRTCIRWRPSRKNEKAKIFLSWWQIYHFIINFSPSSLNAWEGIVQTAQEVVSSSAMYSTFLTVLIDSIYKVTEGRQSEIFHRQAEGNFDPSCCFTIYHGNHMESLDLITSNPEEARTWITGLKYLMAGISDEDSLAKRQRTHDQYPS
ncbi:1-phosphatidylinositol-4,5-bisphosphate phosphodiesterase eta-1 [Pteropus alecto]|uniref:1-phosphatidylinositol-4,5-bisphosphate phosphodiesterase eta-1 n=1 Tax=Pteropus alecto TaxID=9402 RepID=L5KWX9_PTEAL|nr:1-phosphatidylinositol-4,5-bisphosphate phosphodiesterase eta-1 [Pteropus alecto]